MHNKYKGCTLVLAVLLLMTLLPGCSANRQTSNAGNNQTVTTTTPDQGMTPTAIPNATTTTTPATNDTAAVTPDASALTKEQAQEIALKHAGFTADQVERLRTEYEIDDRVPQYDVEFYVDQWEYEYEIHAKSGDIISFDKDNKND